MNPAEIEGKSFEIITEIIGDRALDTRYESIIKRVIHTTADFDYIENLYFSEGVADRAIEALKAGAVILTDTQMARAGINKRALSSLGGSVECFIDNAEVVRIAAERGITRAAVAVEYALENINRPVIFAVGNAPTALLKLHELLTRKAVQKPRLIIGVPVGFVNVVESKELIMSLDVPCIVARGRKGGSTVAAAVCNALIYELVDRRHPRD